MPRPDTLTRRLVSFSLLCTGRTTNPVRLGFALLAVIAVPLMISGCAPRDVAPRVLTGTTMGTSYRLSLGCGLEVELARTLIESAFNEVNQSMSTYISESELMRFNRSEIGDWVAISEPLARVMQGALELARLSDGAFDPTLGALVRLWGFAGGEQPSVPPEQQVVDDLLSQSGLARLEVSDDGRAMRRHSRLALDLSAVAKGFAVDLAIGALESRNCHDLLLEVGGEVGVRGLHPDGRAWKVGIESPERTGSMTRAITLGDEAVATSGDYRNRLVIDGDIYSHTLDPATGRPVTHDLASVSVISTSVMRADALATAMNVMGPVTGPAFARRHGIEAFFIIRVTDGYQLVATGRFDQADTPH